LCYGEAPNFLCKSSTFPRCWTEVLVIGISAASLVGQLLVFNDVLSSVMKIYREAPWFWHLLPSAVQFGKLDGQLWVFFFGTTLADKTSSGHF